MHHVFSFNNFIKGAEICASNISSVEEYLEIVDYKIQDVITFFMLGSDLKVFQAEKMGQYWLKVLDYKYGFCYSFQPPDGEQGVITLSTEPAALNMALMQLNVSFYKIKAHPCLYQTILTIKFTIPAWYINKCTIIDFTIYIPLFLVKLKSVVDGPIIHSKSVVDGPF